MRQSAAAALGLSIPFPPVTWADFDPLLGLGIDPSARRAAAGKSERMDAVLVKDGQLQVLVEGRGGDMLPLHDRNVRQQGTGALIWIKMEP